MRFVVRVKRSAKRMMYLAILCLHRYHGLQQREEECTGIFANTRTVERTLSHLQHFVWPQAMGTK